MIKCKDNTLYTGYTNDLEKRLQLHTLGKAAKYTRGRGPFQLMLTEKFPTKSQALRREYEIKQWDRNKKLAFIQESKEENDANSEKLSE